MKSVIYEATYLIIFILLAQPLFQVRVVYYCFLLGLLFDPEDKAIHSSETSYILLTAERHITKTVHFVVPAARTSNKTSLDRFGKRVEEWMNKPGGIVAISHIANYVNARQG
jgi:hypothetical protein